MASEVELEKVIRTMHTSVGVPPRTHQGRISAAIAALFRYAETVFVIVALFVFSNALIPLVLEAGGATSDPRHGNPVLRSIFMAIQAVGLLFALPHWRSVLKAALAHGPTVLLVTVALASAMWSDAPDITIRRGSALFGTTIFGLYLTARYSARDLLRILGWALGACAILSLAAALLFPAYGLSSGAHQGLWRGIFSHKNTLAQVMVVSVVVFFLLWKGASVRRWVPAACLVLSVVLLVLSGSTSGIVMLGALVALLPLYHALRWRNDRLIFALITAVLAGSMVISIVFANAEAMLMISGKDLTLTGRTELWDAAWTAISERPWLGYGYSAFWLGWEGGAAAIWSAAGWETPHAHNGFIDLWLELGLLGVTLLLIGVVSAGRRAVAAIRSASGPEALWPLSLISVFLLLNFTESVVLRQNNLFWILYVTTVSSTLLRRSDHRIHYDSTSPDRRLVALGHLSPGVRLRHRRNIAARTRPTGA